MNIRRPPNSIRRHDALQQLSQHNIVIKLTLTVRTFRWVPPRRAPINTLM